MKKEVKKGHLISKVAEGSIAEELGIVPGDRLLSVNGQEIEDVFDYRYLVNDEEITLTVITAEDGEEWEYEIEKDASEELGIDFEAGLMSDYRHCSNKCMFCFIDQMPPGMRETLYFKDDDARLSFLQGNYITLTNMKDKDVERICFYKLSPVNISIHTTNPELRNKMLSNRFAGDALRHIKTLVDGGIDINGQIVLCKGVNDGAELDRTLSDIEAYLPGLKSLSVVPVGLTKFRDGLYPLESFTAEDANAFLDQINRWQTYYKKKYDTNLVFASDEWYLTAGRLIPSAEHYEGFPQIENGVGMIRSLLDEFDEAFIRDYDVLPGKFSFITGRAMEKTLTDLMKRVMDKYPQLEIEVNAIRNDFFGEKITVAGLITGQDIIAQMKEKNIGNYLVMPSCMLRAGTRILLDDLTVDDLEKALQTNIRIVKSSGAGLLEVLCKNYIPVFEREVPYEQADSSNSGQT